MLASKRRLSIAPSEHPGNSGTTRIVAGKILVASGTSSAQTPIPIFLPGPPVAGKFRWNTAVGTAAAQVSPAITRARRRVRAIAADQPVLAQLKQLPRLNAPFSRNSSARSICGPGSSPSGSSSGYIPNSSGSNPHSINSARSQIRQHVEVPPGLVLFQRTTKPAVRRQSAGGTTRTSSMASGPYSSIASMMVACVAVVQFIVNRRYEVQVLRIRIFCNDSRSPSACFLLMRFGLCSTARGRQARVVGPG